MLSFFLLLLLLTILVLVILVLRKNQQKHTKETADRTAPLPALGNDSVPDFAPPQFAPPQEAAVPLEPFALPQEAVVSLKPSDNWQLQVKNLRAGQQYGDALEICRSQYPKAQAIAQAAIILRQQIKTIQEKNAPFDQTLQSLYSLAALADIYSSGTALTTAALPEVVTALQNSKQQYQVLGYQQLKLLNKSDVRLLEQAWGKPDTHRHATEVYSL